MPDTESSLGGERIWSVQSLRLTAFPEPSAALDPDSWWNDVAGGPPESETRRVREGITQKQGLHDGAQLTLIVQPPVVHWRLDPMSDPEVASVHVPMIAGLPGTFDRFFERVSRWFALETCPPINRLAFGAVLVQAVNSRTEGYELLSHYLQKTVKLEAELSSDFLYQINRPMSLQSISGLRVNRLSRWHVAMWTYGMVLALPMASGGVQPVTTGSSFAAQLDLDINTDAESKITVLGTQMSDLYRDLATLGFEIAATGDIP